MRHARIICYFDTSMTMGKMRERPHFRPILKARWTILIVIYLILVTPLLVIELEGLPFLFQIGSLLFVWAVFILSIRFIIRFLKSTLVTKTSLTVEEACLVADGYFETTGPEVSKRIVDTDIVYETSHFVHDVAIWVSEMRTRTRFMVENKEEMHTDDYLNWLEGLGKALKRAEEHKALVS